MSLGGYKFSGKFCQRGSLTDQEWAMVLHKTRVEAFLEANAAANAGWIYDMDGSPDGNLHCLDSMGDNYVTVFKRENSETNDTTWFAIYTLCSHKKTSVGSGDVARSLVYARWTDSFSGYLGTYACSFFRIGTSQISYNDDLVDITNLVDSTPLIPTGNPGTADNYYDDTAYGHTVCYWNNSTFYYGTAIKDDNIIMFSGENQTASELCCTIAAGHGVSNLIIPNDNHSAVAVNLQRAGTGGTYDEISPRAHQGTECQVTVAMNDSGKWEVPVGLFVNQSAAYVNTLSGVPYQSVCVGGIKTNDYGIMGKGTMKIDLLAYNAPSTTSIYPSVYTSYSNGNYLCVTTYYSDNMNAMNGAYLGSSYGCLFVGWDASNPDITQSSSWSEVTLA